MKALLINIILLSIFGCGQGADPLSHTGICDGYDPYETSEYILPWKNSESYKVTQGNCSTFSHYGDYRYSYDFDMPTNTSIYAVRAGTVLKVTENYSDGNGCPDANVIEIQHNDGTISSYAHLTQNGALVDEGDEIAQGDEIAKSGNTGCSTDPHLHFQVYSDAGKDETVPITFKQTAANPRGLEEGKTYTQEASTTDIE